MNTTIISKKEDKTMIADQVLDSALNPLPSIEIENVGVSFKTPKGIFTAVKDISLTVKKGEIIS